jgi:U32 family peptidase
MNNKVELLAPGGNLEKLKMAVIYGADAVYIGGQKYGLRAGAGNFTMEEIKEGLRFAHDHGAKLFVTLNVIPHNEDIEGLDQYVKELYDIGIDAIIVADPGAFSIVKNVAPNLEIHISTQANNTNWATCSFWHSMGAKRVVMARELSFEEIKEIREKCPQTMEIEAFIHGAMCMSYSGRCLLSNYMTGRDANRGDCAQSCRWKYHLVEEKRPGEYMPVIEDEGGTYIFNSKDLCMIEYIPQVLESGINSLKIEGRMKSSFYVATVVKAYREAIDNYLKDPDNYEFDPKWLEEIQKASHRDFITGFYLDKPDHTSHIYDKGSYIRNYQFLALVLDYDKENQIATVEQRNRFFAGDEVEIISPKGQILRYVIEQMWDQQDNPIEVAPHPQQIVKIKIPHELKAFDMLRREKEEKSE